MPVPMYVSSSMCMIVTYMYLRTQLAISCIFVGFLIASGVHINGYFWILYICHLALKVFYPLKSAKLFNSDYSRTIYIALFLFIFFIGITLPLVNAGLMNYQILTFPPRSCGATGAYRFYGFIVPAITSLVVVGILMLLTVYKIHVVSLMMYLEHMFCAHKHLTWVEV